MLLYGCRRKVGTAGTLAGMERRIKEEPTARVRLARRLRAERYARGLSQERLADLAGLHRTYVGSVERAERNVSIDNVERLAKALDVDVALLLVSP
jgi:ribosome-binding protein aMBF1 (putative translation factor)